MQNSSAPIKRVIGSHGTQHTVSPLLRRVIGNRCFVSFKARPHMLRKRLRVRAHQSRARHKSGGGLLGHRNIQHGGAICPIKDGNRAALLQRWLVSKRVNSSRASDDDPSMIEPLM